MTSSQDCFKFRMLGAFLSKNVDSPLHFQKLQAVLFWVLLIEIFFILEINEFQHMFLTLLKH